MYFSPECHANYTALGFDPSPGDADGVALPDGPAYFASRGSLLGQVPGEVIAAAFGVFSPAVVVPSVQLAWTRTDAATIRAARADGAVRQLRRLVGDRPDGVGASTRTAAASRGACSRSTGGTSPPGSLHSTFPTIRSAAVWHVGDFLREYRGDCHNAAWVAAGLSATDIGMLTELSWGMPLRSYSRTRGWTTEEFDRSEHHLRDLGHLDGQGADTHLSQQGRHAREQIEVATDEQMRRALRALGGDIDELFDIMAPWGEAIRAGKGYAVLVRDLGQRRIAVPLSGLIRSQAFVWARHEPSAEQWSQRVGLSARPVRNEGVAMTNQRSGHGGRQPQPSRRHPRR